MVHSRPSHHSIFLERTQRSSSRLASSLFRSFLNSFSSAFKVDCISLRVSALFLALAPTGKAATRRLLASRNFSCNFFFHATIEMKYFSSSPLDDPTTSPVETSHCSRRRTPWTILKPCTSRVAQSSRAASVEKRQVSRNQLNASCSLAPGSIPKCHLHPQTCRSKRTSASSRRTSPQNTNVSKAFSMTSQILKHPKEMSSHARRVSTSAFDSYVPRRIAP